jgi:tetratricopeptide (TPR) repeat protein
LLLAQKNDHQRFIMVLESHLGLAYMDYGDYEKSREYLMKSLEYARAEGNVGEEIRALTNIGANYSREKLFKKSKEFHLRGYAVAQENGLRSNEGTILLNIGDCYFNLGDFSQAEYYIRRGVKAAEEEKEFLASIRGIVQLAHLYQDSKPDSAFYFAEKGLELARQTQNKVMEVNSLEVLYQLYEDQGNYQEALVFYKRWKMKNDTIFSEKNERAVFESEIRYTSEKQKLQDQIVFDGKLAQQKLKTQAKIYLLLGAFVLLTVAFAAFFWVVRNRSKKEKMERLDQLELIKERVAVQSVSVEGVRQELLLDKKKIEAYLGKALGDSSWDILNAIYNDPSISNREIAEEVFLSVEGVSSSLRRMYRSFKVSSGNTKNLKVALITKVVGVLMDKSGF